jgi:hypothetical protein
MATHNILTNPAFSQVLQSILGTEIRRVGKVLHLCTHESLESSLGACDGGYPCNEEALPGEEFCSKHFQEVDRG